MPALQVLCILLASMQDIVVDFMHARDISETRQAYQSNLPREHQTVRPRESFATDSNFPLLEKILRQERRAAFGAWRISLGFGERKLEAPPPSSPFLSGF